MTKAKVKALRLDIEDFLDAAVRGKAEKARTGYEDLLLEAGDLFLEQLRSYGLQQLQGEDESRQTANLLKDLRSVKATVQKHRNGRER